MLTSLTSLLVSGVRQLRAGHVFSPPFYTWPVRLEQLVLVKCGIGEPSTLKKVLQTRLMQNSRCLRGHLGETCWRPSTP
ncbi:hypothetical protein BC940DRAFT_314433 [Gongronella butleri]|nr:hypothetical protein BC940DRAFT_314433 [Gongronella butleri]